MEEKKLPIAHIHVKFTINNYACQKDTHLEKVPKKKKKWEKNLNYKEKKVKFRYGQAPRPQFLDIM